MLRLQLCNCRRGLVSSKNWLRCLFWFLVVASTSSASLLSETPGDAPLLSEEPEPLLSLNDGIPKTQVTLKNAVFNATSYECRVAFVVQNCVPRYAPIIDTTIAPEQIVVRINWADDTFTGGIESIPFSALMKHHVDAEYPLSVQTFSHTYNLKTHAGGHRNDNTTRLLPTFECLWLPGFKQLMFHTNYNQPYDISDFCIPSAHRQGNFPHFHKSVVRASHKGVAKYHYNFRTPAFYAAFPMYQPPIWLSPEVVVFSWLSIPWRNHITGLRQTAPSTDDRIEVAVTDFSVAQMVEVVDSRLRAATRQPSNIPRGATGDGTGASGQTKHSFNSHFNQILEYTLNNNATIDLKIDENLSKQPEQMPYYQPVFNIHTLLVGRALPTHLNPNPKTRFLTVAYISSSGYPDSDHYFDISWDIENANCDQDSSATRPTREAEKILKNCDTSDARLKFDPFYPHQVAMIRNLSKSFSQSPEELSPIPASTPSNVFGLSAKLPLGVVYNVVHKFWDYNPCGEHGNVIRYTIGDRYDHRRPHDRQAAVRMEQVNIQTTTFVSTQMLLPLSFPTQLSSEAKAATSDDQQQSSGSAAFNFSWRYHTIPKSVLTSLKVPHVDSVSLDIGMACGLYPYPYTVWVNNIPVFSAYSVEKRGSDETGDYTHLLVLPCNVSMLTQDNIYFAPWCTGEPFHKVTLQCTDVPPHTISNATPSHRNDPDYRLIEPYSRASKEVSLDDDGDEVWKRTRHIHQDDQTIVQLPSPLPKLLTETSSETWSPFMAEGKLFSLTTKFVGYKQSSSESMLTIAMYKTSIYCSKLSDYQRHHEFILEVTVREWSHRVTQFFSMSKNAGGSDNPNSWGFEPAPRESKLEKRLHVCSLNDTSDTVVSEFEWETPYYSDFYTVDYTIYDYYETLVMNPQWSAFPFWQCFVDVYTSNLMVLTKSSQSFDYKYIWHERNNLIQFRASVGLILYGKSLTCPFGTVEQAVEIEGVLMHRAGSEKEYVEEPLDILTLPCLHFENIEKDPLLQMSTMAQQPWCKSNSLIQSVKQVRFLCGQGSRHKWAEEYLRKYLIRSRLHSFK